jgi:hypothetical protein
MSIGRHHNEWLSLVDVSGPFLSLPVLLRVFPHGLDGHDPDTFRAFRRAYDEWRNNQEGLRPDPAVHHLWVRFVLCNILGFPRDLLHNGPSISAWINASLPQYGETLRPDLVIQRSGQPPRILIHVFPLTQGLNKPLAGQRWVASPETRMAELLRGSGVALGLVTNGERWSLVHAINGQTATFASWDAALWLEEPVTLRAFRSLLSVDRTFGVAENETLNALFAQSVDYQQEVTEQLGEQVLRAIEVLVRTFDRVDRDLHRALLTAIAPEIIYEAAVTVMMRLVVLFYAEERELIPGGHQPFYESYYAASTLRAQLRASADELGEEVLERRYDAWSRLLATCRAIFGGVQHEDMKLPAYGGRLFDPNRYAFLEGRASGTNWRDVSAQPLPVDNRTVLHLLEALQMLKQRIPGAGVAEARRLSFKTLDIEQIGHVYEGLLDHTVRRAEEPVLSFVGAGRQHAELPLSALEASRASTAQQKSATLSQLKLDFELDVLPADSPATITLLEEATGRSASAIKSVLQAQPDRRELEQLLIACEYNQALFERTRPFIRLLRRDSFDRIVIILPGSNYVTRSSQRRSGGQYYTPRSITEPVVRHALEPLVYEGVARGKSCDQWQLIPAEDILALTICDIAVGSGAFLVQACRYLADRLCEACAAREARSSAEEGLNTLFAATDLEERRALARRLIADRCLYGVDKDPLAVEMAKLSLWLITLRHDRPFTFLDHAIRCGDSLLGMPRIERFVRPFRNEPHYQRHLFQLASDVSLKAALESRYKLRKVVAVDIRGAEQKQQLEQQATDALRIVRLGADLLTAVHFIKEKKRWKKQLDAWLPGYISLLSPGNSANSRAREYSPAETTQHYEDLRVEALALLEYRQPFHWPFEFPEVFFKNPESFAHYLNAVASGKGWSREELKQYGFSAIIGNPPFQGGQKITGALGLAYRDYLVEELAEGKRGSADLCAYFFLRAGELVRTEGIIGLVATNTIAQGDTREVGLEKLVERGFSIHRAISSQPWPGESSLEVAQIWLRDASWNGECMLDEKPVGVITPFLSPSGAFSGTPYRLKNNEAKSFIGSYVLGMGFVLSPEEATALIERDPRNREVLFPYLNGEDLNSRPDQSPTRWVINFHNWPLERAATYAEPFHIVLEKVKPEREKITFSKNARQKWWQFERRRPELYRAIQGNQQVLIRARIANQHAPAFVPAGWVYNEKAVIFAKSSFLLLQSIIHEVWARAYSSTLKSDLQYTPSDCFETFPFPASLVGSTSMQRSPDPRSPIPDPLEAIGETYHEHRRQVMLGRHEGLTKTYNRFHNQAEHSQDIVELRRLHVEMDQAVAVAYGWDELDLGHSFHETKQGLRYTISESARRTILDRLLALNHQRYADEVALGLHDDGAKRAKGGKGRGRKVVEEQVELF